jgi:hypothetical protein
MLRPHLSLGDVLDADIGLFKGGDVKQHGDDFLYTGSLFHGSRGKKDEIYPDRVPACHTDRNNDERYSYKSGVLVHNQQRMSFPI